MNFVDHQYALWQEAYIYNMITVKGHQIKCHGMSGLYNLKLSISQKNMTRKLWITQIKYYIPKVGQIHVAKGYKTTSSSCSTTLDKSVTFSGSQFSERDGGRDSAQGPLQSEA